MGYCYLCCSEWTGYYGSYFCEECEKLQKIVKVIGAKKITDNIKLHSKKIQVEFSELKEIEENGETNYNLRSRNRILFDS